MGISARQPAASVGYAHAPGAGGEATTAGRGAWRQDGGARRVESNGAIVASPGSARMPSHMMPCNEPTLPCNRARRGGVGDDGVIQPASIDAPNGAPPPRGTQRRTRHRRRVTTTVSSTSSFRRRRGCLLGSRRRGRQAAGRGSTFGAGCAARRAASAPSSARAACVGRSLHGHELALLGSRSASPP